MAISWITALKMVPWSDVIQATPQVVKAAKGLLRKNEQQAAAEAQQASAATGATPVASNVHEHSLQLIRALDERTARLEASQLQSAQLIEQLAEQNAQLVETVGLLRTGTQRLVRACAVLGVAVVGLALYLWLG